MPFLVEIDRHGYVKGKKYEMDVRVSWAEQPQAAERKRIDANPFARADTIWTVVSGMVPDPLIHAVIFGRYRARLVFERARGPGLGDEPDLPKADR